MKKIYFCLALVLTLFVQQNVNGQGYGSDPYPGYAVANITEGPIIVTRFVLNVNHSMIFNEYTGDFVRAQVNSYGFLLMRDWANYTNEGATFTVRGYYIDFAASASTTVATASGKVITRHTVQGTINVLYNTYTYNVVTTTIPVFDFPPIRILW